jgi:hypothetical protein
LIEVRRLVSVPKKTVDLLIHEGHQDLAARLPENESDDFEGGTCPAEWVDEGKGWRQVAAPFNVKLLQLFECLREPVALLP